MLARASQFQFPLNFFCCRFRSFAATGANGELAPTAAIPTYPSGSSPRRHSHWITVPLLRSPVLRPPVRVRGARCGMAELCGDETPRRQILVDLQDRMGVCFSIHAQEPSADTPILHSTHMAFTGPRRALDSQKYDDEEES